MNQPPLTGPQSGPLTLTNSRGLALQGRSSVHEGRGRNAGTGTLQQPEPLELPLLGQQQVSVSLGYEAMPSSWFWAFSTGAHLRLKVQRQSADPAARSVAVALLHGDRRDRVASLVQYADGGGPFITIPPGRYRIVCSLHVPENVSVTLMFTVEPAIQLEGLLPLTLLLNSAEPPVLPLLASLQGQLTMALLLQASSVAPLQASLPLALAFYAATAHHHRPTPGGGLPNEIFVPQPDASGDWPVHVPDGSWHSAANVEEQDGLRRYKPDRPWGPVTHPAHAELALPIESTLQTVKAQPLGNGQLDGALMLQAALSAVKWVDAPLEAWKVRLKGSERRVELNRAYVSLSGDPVKVAQQCAELGLLLAQLGSVP